MKTIGKCKWSFGKKANQSQSVVDAATKSGGVEGQGPQWKYKVLFLGWLALFCIHDADTAFAQVGIGTSTPDASALLDLTSTTKGILISRVTLVQRNAIVSPAIALLIFQTDNTPGYYYNAGTPGVPNWVRLFSGSSAGGWDVTGNAGTTVGTNFLGTTDAQDFAIYTNNAEKLRITSGGNVGIGTTTPSGAAVEISSTANQLMLSDANGGVDMKHIKFNHDGNEFFIQLLDDAKTTSIGAMKITRTGATPQFILFPNGNVGIGTSSPDQILHALGNIRAESGLPGFQWEENDVTADNKLWHMRATGETLELQALTDAGSGGGQTLNFTRSTNQLTSMQFGLATDPTLYVEGQLGGNVGIGTTAPTTKFHVNSIGGNPAILKAETALSSQNASFWMTTAGIDRWEIGTGINNDTDFELYDRQSSLTRLLVENGTGNVGIGTTSPGSLLHVSGGDLKLTGASSTAGTGSHLVFDGNRTAHIWLDDQLDVGTPDQADLYFSVQSGGKAFNFGHSAGLYTKAGFVNWMTINDGNVGIGTTAPTAKLDVNGTVRLRNGATANYVLTSDVLGNATWQDPNTLVSGDNLGNHTATQNLDIANFEVDNISYADIRAANGYGIRFWSDNQYAINMGNLAEYQYGAVTGFSIKNNMSNTVTRGWTWGVDALAPVASINTEGKLSLANFIQIDGNTVIDDAAGWHRSYGNTGWQNPTYGGGIYMTDATWIRTFGNKSFYHNTGTMRTDGTFQVGGTGATLNVINGGTFAYRTDVLFANTAGRVGIGTTAPAEKLHVKDGNMRITQDGFATFQSYSYSNASTGGHFIGYGANGTAAAPSHPTVSHTLATFQGRNAISPITSGGMTIITAENHSATAMGTYIIFGTTPNGATSTLERMRITNAGNVGIGISSPSGQLQLSLDQGLKPATGTWTIVSDERLKNIEGSYTKGLEEILQLQPITYQYKNVGERKFAEEVLNTQNVGFSAQEIQKVFPEAVGTDADGYLNFNMHAVLVAYVNAIQELADQNALLEKSVVGLKLENDTLKGEVAEIKSILGMRAEIK
ncbi:MAG: tail fiber domain-containing protein [Flavobacteriales bacterium]|nr:tail fiber domain-containing protein [Flavobacteriales bacterium]